MKIRYLTIMIFFSIKNIAMQQHPVLQSLRFIKPVLPTRSDELKPLLTMGHECFHHLKCCNDNKYFELMLMGFSKHPEKKFADFWVSYREELLGTARAKMLYSPKLSENLTFNACINYEVVKTFDKKSMKLVKRLLNKPKIESNISTE